MAFFGTHSLQLDEKNRMRIPAKFRAKLGADFYIAYTPGGLPSTIMPAESFGKFIAPFYRNTRFRPRRRGNPTKAAYFATVEQPERGQSGKVCSSPALQGIRLNRQKRLYSSA